MMELPEDLLVALDVYQSEPNGVPPQGSPSLRAMNRMGGEPTTAGRVAGEGVRFVGDYLRDRSDAYRRRREGRAIPGVPGLDWHDLAADDA